MSVCLPVRNQAHYLRYALDSVLTQSLQDFEVIVYDDASTDDPQEVLIAMDDPRIRYFRHNTNVGVAINRNFCLKEARGAYIGWLDADDRYERNALKILSETLDANPQVGLVHAGFHLIDEDGSRLRGWGPYSSYDLVIEPGYLAFRELVLCNYITTSTVMVRSQVQQAAGLFVPSVGRSSTDWNMWLRLALFGDLAYRSLVVAEYRQHANTISAMTSRSGERLSCDARAVQHVFDRHSDSIVDSKSLYQRAMAAQAIRWLLHAEACLSGGRRAAALKAGLQAYILVGQLAGKAKWMRLFFALWRADEYQHYRSSKSVLSQLYGALKETKYGEKIQHLAVVDPEWDKAMGQIAMTVRRVTGDRDRIAAIDKYDPTIFHLSRRKGRHFPDLPGAAKGSYPRDSEQAIAHLETLRLEGIRYLVIPCFASWWLDFYEGFGEHLEQNYRKAWADELCSIYQLDKAVEKVEIS